MRSALIAIIFAIPNLAVASDWATTFDGKQVVLHEDGTWSELKPQYRAPKLMFPGLGAIHWGYTRSQMLSRYPTARRGEAGSLIIDNQSLPAGDGDRRFWDVVLHFHFDSQDILHYVDINMGARPARADDLARLETLLGRLFEQPGEVRNIRNGEALSWEAAGQSTVVYLNPGVVLAARVQRMPDALALWLGHLEKSGVTR